MKIEKHIGRNKNWFCYNYLDSKTNTKIIHGLFNSYYGVGIGYCYHDERKGFWLRNKKYL